ncbi:uncharacterized protein [Pyrus communis]|uniref:uncharacterized protein isoform X1 n=1 Tax=Pyrus communis TaxID=23211 RepID=UPI0035C149C9
MEDDSSNVSMVLEMRLQVYVHSVYQQHFYAHNSDTWICSNLSDKHYYEATTICEYLHTCQFPSQTHGYVPISATSTTMRPLPYANIFIHIDEHVRREIMNHRSLKHPNILRSKEMQMDEHVQREIINHKSLKNLNIIRFKELLFSIRQH